jgi:hypothetical protein
MLKNSPFYAGFAVDDLERAREFYGQTLGVFDVTNVSSDERSLPPTPCRSARPTDTRS